MELPNFKELCNSFCQSACVVSIEKLKDGAGEIRIVDGNDAYLTSFSSEMYNNHVFVPNRVYTEYLPKNLNFEDYCYRSAVKKELLHSYAYPEHFKVWMHMLFIPLAFETKELSYCLYIMEMNNVFDPELLASPRGDVYNKVLNTILQLSNSGDFQASVKNVTREIRKLCNAFFCCVLLIDEIKEKLTVLSEDREPVDYPKTMQDFLNNNFYDIVKTWDDIIDNNGNCVIVKSQKEMDYIKEKSPTWYQSLVENDIHSLVLFKIKSGSNRLGYMWVSNFKTDDTPRIKEALEITTFVLGSQIANHLMLQQLTRLSSIDPLTGLYNRNKLNEYMNEISDSPDASTSLIFLDINGLKKVNDQQGHLAGDSLIKRAASTLRNALNYDHIFRVGGDEFVIIYRDIEEKQINSYISAIRKKAENNNVSFAIGYAMTNKSKEIEQILKEADVNMYNDKHLFYKKA